MLEQTLVILAIVLLLLINAVGVVLVALQAPGTWLMLLATAVMAWWRWDAEGLGSIGGWTLVGLLGLAVLGEVIEFIAGAAGATKAGGSKRGAALAVIGGVVGAVLGAIFLAFIPIVGVLIGAAIGAGVGSILGDLWAGREWNMALTAGRGAAIGKFWGALGKLAVAAAMWAVVAVAVLWP